MELLNFGGPYNHRTQVLQSVLKFLKFHSFRRMEMVGFDFDKVPLIGINFKIRRQGWF